MEKAKVYFTDMRVHPGTNLPEKLKKLIKRAGIGEIDFEKKMTAIKIHFGEPGNLSFLRPNYAKAVADVVKEFGGRPFLTDCNTLYVGRRKDALEHLSAAYENGFNILSTGCHIIIGDGLKGTDDVSVPVKGGTLVKEAKIGRAVMDADVFISLSHFKGHEMAGFGGCFKNIGMGCGSRAGKMEQHNSGKPSVDPDLCVGCGRCLGACNQDAVYNENSSAVQELNIKMAEYTKAVLDGRPSFHINLVIDVSPYCDCHAENDVPIIPDVGMFASFDPVALDQACVDACNAQQPVKGSMLDENMHAEGFCDHHDHFVNTTPESEWETCLSHAVELGLGTREYELIEVK